MNGRMTPALRNRTSYHALDHDASYENKIRLHIIKFRAPEKAV